MCLRCLRLIQYGRDRAEVQVFGKSQEKHRALRLGQTVEGAPNDRGLFPPRISGDYYPRGRQLRLAAIRMSHVPTLAASRNCRRA